MPTGVYESGNGYITIGSGGKKRTETNEQNAVTVPDTTVQDKLREATDIANRNALNAYNNGVNDLNNNTQNLLKEAYITRMMADRDIPKQLSARGINGGMSETTIAGNRNNYLTNRANIQTDANRNLMELQRQYQSDVNENERSLADQIAEYQKQLKLLEIQAKYDKELAMLK